ISFCWRPTKWWDGLWTMRPTRPSSSTSWTGCTNSPKAGRRRSSAPGAPEGGKEAGGVESTGGQALRPSPGRTGPRARAARTGGSRPGSGSGNPREGQRVSARLGAPEDRQTRQAARAGATVRRPDPAPDHELSPSFAGKATGVHSGGGGRRVHRAGQRGARRGGRGGQDRPGLERRGAGSPLPADVVVRGHEI